MSLVGGAAWSSDHLQVVALGLALCTTPGQRPHSLWFSSFHLCRHTDERTADRSRPDGGCFTKRSALCCLAAQWFSVAGCQVHQPVPHCTAWNVYQFSFVYFSRSESSRQMQIQRHLPTPRQAFVLGDKDNAQCLHTMYNNVTLVPVALATAGSLLHQCSFRVRFQLRSFQLTRRWTSLLKLSLTECGVLLRKHSAEERELVCMTPLVVHQDCSFFITARTSQICTLVLLFPWQFPQCRSVKTHISYVRALLTLTMTKQA